MTLDFKDYLNQIVNLTDQVVSDNCFAHETKDVIQGIADIKYYLHERTLKRTSSDLKNGLRIKSYPDREVWSFDITEQKLGEEVGTGADILIQCDKLTPVSGDDIVNIENDYTDAIAYIPLHKKVYISVSKDIDNIQSYLDRKNFEFIFPSLEQIYEVNPLYVRSYHPKTNLSIRGSKIIPRVECKADTNLQTIAIENLIRLQQLEGEVFKI